MPETTTNINEKLATIQHELKAPKGQQGRFGKHRNVEDILTALKPIAFKHGCSVTLDNQLLYIGERYYVQATATLHYKGDTISVNAQAWEGEISRGLDAPQVTGSASSYARKYALGGLFAVDDTKDPDSHKDDPDVPPVPAPAKAAPQKDSDPATPQQKQQLKNMMSALAMEPDAMSMMVESVLNKPTVDTYTDFKAVVEAMEMVEDDKQPNA